MKKKQYFCIGFWKNGQNQLKTYWKNGQNSNTL